MATLEERVSQLEVDLPTRRGYVKDLQTLRQGQQLLLQRMDTVENRIDGIDNRMDGIESDVSDIKSDIKLMLEHFKIGS